MKNKVFILAIILAIAIVGIVLTQVFIVKKINRIEEKANSSQASTVKKSGEIKEENTKNNNYDENIENTKPQEPTSIKKAILQWKFKTRLNENDIPITAVYVLVTNEKTEEFKIGEYRGNFDKLIKEDSAWELPEGELMSCFGSWAGQGDVLSVIKSQPNELSVEHLEWWSDSGTEEEPVDETNYSTISSFPIKEGVEIEVKEPIIEDETELKEVN